MLADKKDVLETEEIKRLQVIVTHSDEHSDEFVQWFLANVDANGDGVIQLNEFVDFMKKAAEESRKKRKAAMQSGRHGKN